MLKQSPVAAASEQACMHGKESRDIVFLRDSVLHAIPYVASKKGRDEVPRLAGDANRSLSKAMSTSSSPNSIAALLQIRRRQICAVIPATQSTNEHSKARARLRTTVYVCQQVLDSHTCDAEYLWIARHYQVAAFCAPHSESQ